MKKSIQNTYPKKSTLGIDSLSLCIKLASYNPSISDNSAAQFDYNHTQDKYFHYSSKF